MVRGDQRTPLTAMEVRFLAYLAHRPGEAVPLSEIHREVWSIGPRVRTRAVYYAVRRLREVLEPSPREPVVLVGTEGAGFRLTPVVGGRLIGRQAEIAAIRAALDPPAAFVVVTGPSGIGKSAVLLEVARAVGAVGPVDADGAVAPRDLAAAIGRALGRAGRRPGQADRGGAGGAGPRRGGRDRLPRPGDPGSDRGAGGLGSGGRTDADPRRGARAGAAAGCPPRPVGSARPGRCSGRCS